MRPIKLTLIISTYEQAHVLEKVLRGVSLQAEAPSEILIADDGSGPTTRTLVENWLPRLPATTRHIWHDHAGFRKTVILNKAVAAATGDYLVFLDGDCVPHRCFIADHARLAEPGFWVQGRRCFVQEHFVPAFSIETTRPWLWFLQGRISGFAKGARLPFPIVLRNMEQRGIIGCNMAFWREDLLAVNGFDEAYAGWGIGEDSDVGTRLYHLGRPRKFVYGRAIVYHLNHPMAGRTHVAASHQRLAETIRSGKVRCERGLSQYVGQTSPA